MSQGSNGGYPASTPAPHVTLEPSEAQVNEEDEPLFITAGWKRWEKEYYIRLAQAIHRQAVAELNRNEESLFMLFMIHDENLDGTIEFKELKALLKQVSRIESDDEVEEVLNTMDSNQNRCVSFLELLRWWSGEGNDGSALPQSSIRFDMVSTFVGVMGSGYLQTDDRIRNLDLEGLRRYIVGYKRVLRQISDYKVSQQLEVARKSEEENGLGPLSMQFYYDLLVAEFDGDMGLLFDLFCQCDVSGNMLLEHNEVVELLLLLDSAATPEDIERYIDEINLEDGTLSYALLIDWWDQAREVPNSLVSEKGAYLLTKIKARVGANRMLSLLPGESENVKKWRDLAGSDPVRLRSLREGYRQALLEVRRYKMTKRIREAEHKCAIP